MSTEARPTRHKRAAKQAPQPRLSRRSQRGALGGAQPRRMRDPEFAMLHLEDLINETDRRVRAAEEDDVFIKLGNSLAMSVAKLVQAHRILAFLAMQFTTREEAQKELEQLGFEID